jgi:transposase
MGKKPNKPPRALQSRRLRRSYPDDFKQDAVQMLLDGHTAQSIVERLGLSSTNTLYRWKREQLQRSGPAATSLEARVRELELELHRVERERDILKKALAIFGRQE